MSRKEILIRNKARNIRKAKQIYNDISDGGPYQPEHVRLNIDPIMKKSEGFEPNMDKNNAVVASSGGGGYAVMPTRTSRRVVVRANEEELPETTTISYPPHQVGTLSGMSNDFSWTEAPMIDGKEVPEDANQESFRYDDVVAPTEQFIPEEQQEPNEEQEMESAKRLDILDVAPGDYCVIIGGDIVYSSESIKEVEDILEMILFDNKSVSSKEISVFKKLDFKVGVSVR